MKLLLRKPSKFFMLEVLVIAFIIGIALFPWSKLSNYGQFNGFDSSNLYIQPNPDFDVSVNSTLINVKGGGPTSEVIHLSLSDLPYTASFSLTLINKSTIDDPVKVSISFPLIENRIEVVFSSDNYTYFFLYSNDNDVLESKRLVGYSIGYPIDFMTSISTYQSPKQAISLAVSNQTATSDVTVSSEVSDLLNDQARLLSIEINGPAVLDPSSLTLNEQSLLVQNIGLGNGKYQLLKFGDNYSVVSGTYNEMYLEHKFATSANLSRFNSLIVLMNGSATNQVFRAWCNTDWSNRFFYYLQDNFVGIKQVILPLREPDSLLGNASLDSVSAVGIDFPATNGTWGISSISLGSVKYEPLEVNVSNFTLTINPHLLAYAPLISESNLAFVLVLVSICVIPIMFHSSAFKTVKSIKAWIRRLRSKKLILFLATFFCIFLLYFAFFDIGDHAFDMFSQKLWSYDTAKYGLLSLFQRPAVTSAASMYDGQGTQNAIFPYGPVAGLYYYLIGNVYTFFNSNPSVYDHSLTILMKSFQTIVTLLCGLLAFALMRRYNQSFRNSFLIMLVFFLNPLVLYDAAIWGHQDALLILFLFISLWAYETNHSNISYMSLAIAILVKSTAIAPAVLMLVLLVRKFGFKKMVNGAVTGLATAMAIISPYVFSGASPIMLFNSTVFRLFQFGSTTFQYIRSAAVSPDGYNIWPLCTYFTGATSRGRMWTPDFLPSPFFGISYLLAGEILFCAFALVLIILVVKNHVRLAGSAPLVLAILMFASTMFLTKVTARYWIFGVAYLILSVGIISGKIKWPVIATATFTSVFAMQGLLVYYTGYWLQLYPTMSPSIPINGLILSLYQSDIIISEMIILNLCAFCAIFAATIKRLIKS